ncbi:MAG: TonB-dependent receptor [Bacteroidetes bacterium]|nr:TonB-dependent receptor [Bacteroidota bacterium]
MMKPLRTYLTGLLFVCGCLPALHAQDSLRPALKKPVVIEAPRGGLGSAAVSSLPIDSALTSQYAQQTMSDLLLRHGVFVKTYGSGSLASIGVRGSSASHTPVVWNGINLQSSANGQVDFALLPVFLFQSVQLNPGSTSAAWGSGAIGGAVMLGSSVQPGDSVVAARASSQFGSFGENGQALQFLLSRSRMAVSVRGVRQLAINNFPFRNTTLAGSPEQEQTNASVFMQAATADFGWMPGRKGNHRIGAHIWLQENNRHIAPSMLQLQSNATQYDRSARFLLTHAAALNDNRTYIRTRAALLLDELRYTSGYTGDSSSITTGLTQITETEINRILHPRAEVNLGINNTFSQVEVTRFLSQRSMNRTALFAIAAFTLRPHTKIILQFRGEQVNGRLLQPVGSAGFTTLFARIITFNANLSRNYRLPTFNDLYWQPGGNPQLKPEKSWNAETSVNTMLHHGNWFTALQFTGFVREVYDWIQWIPNGAYWSPRNVWQVWARGAETRIDIGYRRRKWKISSSFGYDYVRSINKRSISPNDQSVNKQLIYVPAHRAFGILTVQYHDIYFTYTHQYTSHFFTSTDHSTYLPAFTQAQVTAGTTLQLKQFKAECFVRVNNLYNTAYQAMPLRPMPPRSFQLGMRIDFQSRTSSINTK